MNIVVAQFESRSFSFIVYGREARAASKNMSPLGAPAGYFRWALQDLVRNPQTTAIALAKPTPAANTDMPSLMEKFLTARSKRRFRSTKRSTTRSARTC